MHSTTTPAALGALFLSLALATGAQAAPLRDVTYDLADSSAILSIPALGATTEIPPNGAIFGVQTIRYTSDSAYGIATGPVELLSFRLSLSVPIGRETYTSSGGRTFTVLDDVRLYMEFLSLTSSAPTGQRLAGGTVTPLGASGRFALSGTIHCYKLCTSLNVTATTFIRLSPAVFTAPLPSLRGAVGGYNTVHTVTGTATGFAFALAPLGAGVALDVTGTLSLVGREIRRCPHTGCPPLPPPAEPSTLMLLAGGVAGLGLAAWRRRTRG